MPAARRTFFNCLSHRWRASSAALPRPRAPASLAQGLKRRLDTPRAGAQMVDGFHLGRFTMFAAGIERGAHSLGNLAQMLQHRRSIARVSAA